MKYLNSEGVQQSVASALERMCFVMTEPAQPDTGGDFGWHVAIDLFSDVERTRLLLSATDGFLQELASSMIGAEPEEVSLERDGLEALKELTNICGGEVTELLGGADLLIRCGIPESVGAADLRADLEVVLDSMGELLRVRIQRDPVCA